jgi:lysophospholipase L1-like esterase
MLDFDHTLRSLALGDSYTSGENVAEAERWPVLLAGLIRERGAKIDPPHIVAQSGWTSAQLSAGIDRANPQGPFDLVTLQIGVNDQVAGRSPDDYLREFSALLARAISYAGGDPGGVIVLSIPDWSVTPHAQGQDRQQIAQQIERFNTVNKEATWELGAHYVDVTPISRRAADDPSLLAGDGLHPSARQYAEWAALAFRAARSALGIPK